MIEAEAELKALMLRGLRGDAAAHRAFLAAVAGNLRAYYRSLPSRKQRRASG